LAIALTGQPGFARRLPICSHFFPVRIRVWEVRRNGFFPVDTRGRRFKSKDGKEIYQTIAYGDIIPPKLSAINMTASGNVLELVLTEDGEFHPLALNIDEITKSHEFKPQSMEQKAIWRIEWEDSRNKYAKRSGMWEKIAPYIAIVVVGFIIIILIKITFDGMAAFAGDLTKSSNILADALKYAGGAVGQSPGGNYTY
jgi:hypothetical protein